MDVVASFAGRGIDVHKDIEPQSNFAYSLLMNLRDGVANGRVRGFVVQGAGADVFGDVASAIEAGELPLDVLTTRETRREAYKRRMRARTPEQRSAFLDAQERDLL